MDLESLRREYRQRGEKYRHLKDEVLYILKRELKSQQPHIHQITGRVKPPKSFIDKTLREKSDAPFDTIIDICGVRVICLFLSDLKRVGEIVESSFVIHSKDDKIHDVPEEAFGYFSIHYVGSLPSSYTGPRYDDLRELKFEIQLRTIAMHSWATISHYLDYKSPHAIPSNLRKDFYALSALFYIADTRFEDFHRSSQEAKETAEEKAQRLPEFGKEEINYDTLVAYMRNKYPDRGQADAAAVSELVEELRAASYTEIEQLEVALQRSATAFEACEKDHPPIVKRGARRYADVGVVRVSLSIADASYLDYRKTKISESMVKEYESYRHMLS